MVKEKGEIFKNCVDYVKHVGQNIAEIALAHTVKEIQALLSFTIFVKNWEIQNGRHFWREGKILKLDNVLKETLWFQNLLEIALSLMVCEIFAIFHFSQKSKMAARNNKN